MNTDPPQCSAFVTAVAWLFIILGGFASFIALMQNVAVHFLFSQAQLRQALPATEHMPAPMAFLYSHLGLLFGLVLVLALLTLVAAIGLLKRLNWARLLFIVLMGVAIAWNIGSLLMQKLFMSRLHGNAPQEILDQTRGMMNVMGVFSIILAVVLSLACGWIAWRLASPSIRREFHSL